jgi:23S rRNA pseudouridine1911/1915/1917 synthase
MKRHNQTRLHKVVTDYVRENQLDFTSPEVQKNIEAYGVLVDGLQVKNRLEWVYGTPKIRLNSWPMRDHGALEDIKIVYEDENLLVVDKPFGVVVQSGAGHMKDNLIDYLAAHYPSIQHIDTAKHPSKGLINRIDKDTQGIVLVAKNQAALEWYQAQFKSRLVEKYYLARVDGVVEQSFEVQNWQARSKSDPTRQKLFWTEKEALDYDTNARFAQSTISPQYTCSELGQSIVKVQIYTGRMHQIRLQCQALGFALVADKKYIQKPIPSTQAPSGMFAEVQEKDAKSFEKLLQSCFRGHEYGLFAYSIKLAKMGGGEVYIHLLKQIDA